MQSGKIINLEVEPNDTIATVKRKINDKERIPFDKFYCRHRGRRLLENRTITDYNIQSESVILLPMYKPKKPYKSISKSNKQVLLFGELDNDIIHYIIPFLDVTELVTFSLTCSRVYDLVNVNREHWSQLAQKLQIGYSKADCLELLYMQLEPIRQRIDAKLKVEAEYADSIRVLGVALLNSFNANSDIKCELEVKRSIATLTITNKTNGSIKLPLAQPSPVENWDEGFSMYVYHGISKELKQMVCKEKYTEVATEKMATQEDFLILKPFESVTTQFKYDYTPNDFLIFVAVMLSPSKTWWRQVMMKDTNPFTRLFWEDLWKNRGITTYSGDRLISNAVTVGSPHSVAE